MDMERWLLEVTVISARNLKDVRTIRTMHPYVVASLLNDQGHIEGQRSTLAFKKDGTSPCWNHTFAPPFTVNLAAALDGRVTLKFEIKTERTFQNHKGVGLVDVPVKELLEQGGVGGPWEKSFPVRLHSGGTRGTLYLSYRFGEAFIVPGPPPHPPPHQPPPDQQPLETGRRLLRAAMIGNAVSNLCGHLWDMVT